MGKRTFLHMGIVSVAVLAVAGCDDGSGLGGKAAVGPASAAVDRPATTRLVERDVEAPEVFSKDENGLWDGRPSLGGVWIAHPDVKEPERVIIRNPGNGKFVIGALFKRERENPGPKLQVSSDAANALGVLPGAPTRLSVVALVREEVPEAAPAAAAAPASQEAEPAAIAATAMASGADAAIAAPEESDQAGLDAPLAAAEAAITAAQSGADGMAATGLNTATATAATATAAAEPTPRKAKKGFWARLTGKPARRAKADATISAAPEVAPAELAAPTAATLATPEITAAPLAPAPTRAAAAAPAPKASGKNFIQIGIFSVQDNAERTATNMRKAGVVPTVYEQQSAGKTFWRVVIGPARSPADRRILLEKVKAMGFQDAYFVTD